MYRKTLERKQYERKVSKCAAMRAAKEWKRLAEAQQQQQPRRVAT